MLVAPAEQGLLTNRSLPSATDPALALHAYSGHAGIVAGSLSGGHAVGTLCSANSTNGSGVGSGSALRAATDARVSFIRSSARRSMRAARHGSQA